MSDPLDHLTTALADRYAIERELGRGGMATVCLAEDLKHHRKVAVKMLRPELSATIGVERFLREIEIAAKLNHPQRLPLLDSVTVSGRTGERADRTDELLSRTVLGARPGNFDERTPITPSLEPIALFGVSFGSGHACRIGSLPHCGDAFRSNGPHPLEFAEIHVPNTFQRFSSSDAESASCLVPLFKLSNTARN